jgi:tryptophan 2,3-dioxygenase
MTTRELNYASYLRLDELLELQDPRSDEHDELLFIIIHQVYELWFKQLLHELDELQRRLEAGELFPATAIVRRACTILKTIVRQLDILETMTPLSFASFRERLDTASGFQSVQNREIEFALGFKRPGSVERLDATLPRTARALERWAEPTVVDAFYRFLAAHGVDVPIEILERDVTEPNGPCEALHADILKLYRERPDMAILFELMVDFDEGLQEFRYRHVKIAERTIGSQPGTGGSSGVEYLKSSLFQPIFHDLWAVRKDF